MLLKTPLLLLAISALQHRVLPTRGHLLGLVFHCNCPALSYKMPGQTSVVDNSLETLLGKFNPRLEQHTQ
jgi:hypothetical protein